VYDLERADDRVKAGNTTFINAVRNYRGRVQRLKLELDRINAKLDQVNNEPPLCASTAATGIPTPSGVRSELV
jgi:hypothetical protein